ncbi:hypothetical protein [Desulfonatronum sp. SC1]|uniref:hypothetical protein n=1 Tax=Desulfonatronum sp. SC1 TaxID=2109626 RepID=UPI000D32065E|nr:hypothetical protein [Desulfonatronum sp. SC1]PTN37049.1 hypothetical protein C6366_08070 [Desulfonatronum sp. SC1]
MRRWSGPTLPFHATPERVERFRADNRLGEMISGTFLGWDGPGIGWVDFQGTKLLASMASRPEVGKRLHFLVKQLIPDIILQELSSSGLPEAFPLLQRLWTEQSRLETSLASLWSSVPQATDYLEQAQGTAPNAAQSWAARLAAWRRLLDQRPEARQDLHRLHAAQEPINTELTARGIGRFFVLPWLVDRVRGAGLLLGGPPCPPGQEDSGPSAPQAVFFCTHPVLGQLEVHFVLPGAHQAQHQGWTLHLNLEAIPSRTIASVSKWLLRAFPRPESGALSFQGVKPLPSGDHSGLLPRLLLASIPGRPRLHIKV